VKRNAAVGGLQRVLERSGDSEQRSAGDGAADGPSSEDDGRKRNEAASRDHSVGIQIEFADGKVCAAQAGERAANRHGEQACA